MGGTPLNKPASGMVGQPGGYLMVGEDGGIFTFGDVAFKGSLGASPPPSRVVSVAASGPPLVYDWQHVARASGSGDADGSPVTLAGGVVELNYTCNSTGAYHNGCRFALYNYDTGSFIDSKSPDANTTGTLILHPTPGRYYVQVSEYNDSTNWSWTLRQQVCIQNCS